MTATRRLAAILAADVASYSRLVGVEEEGTLDRLKALRSDLVDVLKFSGLHRFLSFRPSRVLSFCPSR